MKNSVPCRIPEDFTSLSSCEILSWIKLNFLSHPTKDLISSNEKCFKSLYESLNYNYDVEKCDVCFKFSFFSYRLMTNNKAPFWLNLLIGYIKLYHKNKQYPQCFSAITLLVHFYSNRFIFSYNEVNKEFQKYIEGYNNRIISKIVNNNEHGLENFFSEKQFSQIFLVYIDCISNISINHDVSQTLLNIFEGNNLSQIMDFFSLQNNSKEKKTYVQLLLDLFFLTKKIFNTLLRYFFNPQVIPIIQGLNSISIYMNNIIISFFEYKNIIKILDPVNVREFFIVVFLNIQLLLSKFLKDKNIKSNIDNNSVGHDLYPFKLFTNKIESFFQNNDNNIDTKQIIAYSDILGKIMDIYTQLSINEEANNYSLRILSLFHKSHIVTVPVLFCAIQTLKSFIKEKQQLITDENYFYTNISKQIQGIFTIINDLHIENKEDKENVLNLYKYFINIIENHIKYTIRYSIKALDNLEGVLQNTYSDFSQCSRIINVITNNKETNNPFILLIKLILEKEDEKTFLSILLNDDITEETKIKYLYIIACFMCKSKKFVRIIYSLQKIGEEINLNKNYFILFYSNIIFFMILFKLFSEEYLNNLVDLLILLDIFVVKYFDLGIYNKNSQIFRSIFQNLTRLLNHVIISRTKTGLKNKKHSQLNEINEIDEIKELFNLIRRMFKLIETFKEHYIKNKISIKDAFFNSQYAMFFFFVNMLNTLDKEYICLFIKNPQAINSICKDDPVKIKLFNYCLISVVKCCSDNKIVKCLSTIKTNELDFDYLLSLDILNELNENTKNKKINKKNYFDNENILTTLKSNTIIKNQFEKIIDFAKKTYKYNTNFNFYPFDNKIDILYGMIILSENYKLTLLNNEFIDSLEMIGFNNYICNKLLDIFSSNKICYMGEYVLLKQVIQIISFLNKPLNLNNKNTPLDLLNVFIDNNILNVILTDSTFYLEACTVIKLYTYIFIKLISLNINGITNVFEIENLIQILKKFYNRLISKRKVEKINIYEYILENDLNFILHIISTYEIFSSSQIIEESPLKVIEKERILFEETLQLYSAVKSQSLKQKLSDIDNHRLNIIQDYFDDNCDNLNHKSLRLLHFFNYEIILFDLVYKLKFISLSLFKKLYSLSICDDIVKYIHSLNKIKLIKYDEKFLLNIVTYLIKSTRKYEHKNKYSLIKEEYDFNNNKNSSFELFENKLLNTYISLKYYSETNDSPLDIPKSQKLNDDYIINKHFDFPYDNEIDNSVLVKKSKKENTYYIKHCLFINDQKENYDKYINKFELLFHVNSEIMTTFYLNKFYDLQFKYEIKLIPYIFRDYFVSSCINETTIDTIISISSNTIRNSLSLFKSQWSEYKKIKNIQKVIKCLLYLATIIDEEQQLVKLIRFYIKNLLNFKYTCLLNKQQLDNHKNNNEVKNIMSIFRIKKYIYFYIEYKGKSNYCYLNMFDNNITHFFDDLSNILSLNYSNEQNSIRRDLIAQTDNEIFIQLNELQKLLICNNTSIKEIVSHIYKSNNNFIKFCNNYIETKQLNTQQYTIDNFIDWLIMRDDNNSLNTKTNNNFLQSKNKLKTKVLLQDNDSFLNRLKHDFISTFNSEDINLNLFSDESDILYYIPCGEMSDIPLENIPIFYYLPIIRNISYQYIETLIPSVEINLNLQQDIFYILNPTQDLNDSETIINPILDKYNIKGIKSREPKPEEVQKLIKDKKLFIYSGHGDGTKYINLNYIISNDINFISFLFGCSSAKVDKITGKDSQPLGLVNYFLQNGCPFFLGFLWSVTSRDLDKLLVYILTKIFKYNYNKQKVSLMELILRGKRLITRKYLNGSALVCYGKNDICFI